MEFEDEINPARPRIVLRGGLPGLNDEIPKILHMGWIGKRPLSDLNRRCIDSWRRHHTGWNVWMWCDEESQPQMHGYHHARIDESAFVTGGLMRAARNLGEASDILRLELLRQYGGVWVDCDLECFKPIDEIAQRGFFTSMGPHANYMQLENAVMGACLGHPIVESMTRALPVWLAVHPQAATIYRAGPCYIDYWCRVWMGQAFGTRKAPGPVPANSVTVLPMGYYFEPGGYEVARQNGAFGYHHGTGSWVK